MSLCDGRQVKAAQEDDDLGRLSFGTRCSSSFASPGRFLNRDAAFGLGNPVNQPE